MTSSNLMTPHSLAMIRCLRIASMNDKDLHASLNNRIHRDEIVLFWRLLMGIEGTLATIQTEMRQLTELLRTSNVQLPPTTTPQNTIDPEIVSDLMELIEELQHRSSTHP